MSTATAAGRAGEGVVYEVNLDVDAAIRDDYLAWLADHMREIRALPGVDDARLLEVHEPGAAPGRMSLCVHYTMRDADALATYLREHAPRLRAAGEARFGGRFHASRRVLHGLARA
jgi:hypothetical protein